MITKGSKIELVKVMGPFAKVGEVCEVIKVTEDAVITFRCSIGTGVMSYDEFKTYFKEYEEPKKEKIKKKKWTVWRKDIFGYFDFAGYGYDIPVMYRHNGLEVQLKTCFDPSEHKNFKTKARCHKDDKFDLDKGLELADARMAVKLLQYDLEQMKKDM